MKKSNIHRINLNNYVRPNPHTLVTQTNKYITNGTDNSYFLTVEKAYLGSPTNQAIIDNYSNYILGEGLEDVTGLINIETYLSEEDQRLAFTDYKMQGACAFQVMYNMAAGISKLYYIPTKSLSIDRQEDITEEPKAYWYSFDWTQKSKFRPEKYAAFGYGDKIKTEILYIKRASPQPLFALPDWQSGIQYCQTEEELSNYYINHIRNNFSAGKLINIFDGVPENDEQMEEAKRAVIREVTGTSAAGTVIVSFNANKENATTIENIDITDAYSQFQFLSTECIDKIMLAHKVNDKALFGFNNSSGFSSTAEQTIQSMKILYRSQINPIRRALIKGLEKVFVKISPESVLKFKDFPELQVETKTELNQQEVPNGICQDCESQELMDIELESFIDYPQAASDNAQQALDWAEKNGWGSCGTPVGKIRANQLAKREPISRDIIGRMASFERHRQNSQGELGDGCGRLMWQAWGGDEGIAWAQRKIRQE